LRGLKENERKIATTGLLDKQKAYDGEEGELLNNVKQRIDIDKRATAAYKLYTLLLRCISERPSHIHVVHVTLIGKRLTSSVSYQVDLHWRSARWLHSHGIVVNGSGPNRTGLAWAVGRSP